MINDLAGMILDIEGLKARVRQQFPEATEEMEIMLLLAVFTYEYAFQRLGKKEVVMSVLARSFDIICLNIQRVEIVEKELAEWVERVKKIELSDKSVFVRLACVAVISNLIRLQKAKGYNIAKDNFIAWLEKSWDLGVNQRRVFDHEILGSIMSPVGIIIDFGTDLVLCGHEKGFLTQSLDGDTKEEKKQ